MSSSFIGHICCDQVPTWNSSWLQSTHVSDGTVSECHKTFLSVWCQCQLSLSFSAAVSAAGGQGHPLGSSPEPCGCSCVQTWIIMNTMCAPGRTDLCFRFVLPRNISAPQVLENEVVSTLAFPLLWMFLLLDLCYFEINQVHKFV